LQGRTSVRKSNDNGIALAVAKFAKFACTKTKLIKTIELHFVFSICHIDLCVWILSVSM